MVPDVAKDAGSIRNFKGQSNFPADTNCPSDLARLYSLEFPAGRKFVATQEIGERTVDRCPVSFAEAPVGFVEAPRRL